MKKTDRIHEKGDLPEVNRVHRKSSKKERNYMKWMGVMPGLILLITPLQVCAGDLQSTNLIQGFSKLLADGATAGCFLEAAVLTFLEIKEGIALQAAAVEESSKHKKKMVGMAGVGILVICITALVPVLFGYFQ